MQLPSSLRDQLNEIFNTTFMYINEQANAILYLLYYTCLTKFRIINSFRNEIDIYNIFDAVLMLMCGNFFY